MVKLLFFNIKNCIFLEAFLLQKVFMAHVSFYIGEEVSLRFTINKHMEMGCDKFDEKRVTSLIEKGNEFHDYKKYTEALEQYQKAWQALPEPKLEWDIANWISACMYSAYFDLADYAEAKTWGETTLRTCGSDVDTAPLIDLGMVCYELNQFEEAYKYFNDAYHYGKERAFQDRPIKYIEFYLRKGT
ncbi:hypothetical protein [Enterobacter ludwigii]|uniref:hypothetical protein n=1 Tax=Enterobacter ludwigii TaxID=299767 RepID=UPI001F4A0146|nr:hypothetical protein [Enterobacter ludwigii]